MRGRTCGEKDGKRGGNVDFGNERIEFRRYMAFKLVGLKGKQTQFSYFMK